MRIPKFLRCVTATLICWGMALPGQCFSAEPADPVGTAIVDVGLQQGGLLHGQLVDVEGQPRAGAPITVLYQNQPIAETRTNDSGEFQVSGLRGGIHSVSSDQSVAHCRLWTPATAPPQAPGRMLIVEGGEVVRGKSRRQHRMAHALSNPWLLLGVGAVAIAVPVALNGDEGNSGS